MYREWEITFSRKVLIVQCRTSLGSAIWRKWTVVEAAIESAPSIWKVDTPFPQGLGFIQKLAVI